MPELNIIDRTGDTKKVWDADNADQVADAKRTFNDLKKKGYIAYHVKKKGAKGAVMTEFDPEAGKMIMVPPMAGG